MPVSANILTLIRRSWIVVCLFGGLLGGSGSFLSNRAEASCGDYLLHGPVDVPMAADHSQPFVVTPLLPFVDPGSGESEPSERRPSSPCENGRCQPAPTHPPVNSPTRAVHDKQPLPLDLADLSNIDSDSADWARAADGRRPDGPWIPVDLPPPKRAC